MRDLLDLRFRLRAEELRALAGEMTVEQNQQALLRTAEEYERLAESAELMELSKRKLARLDSVNLGNWLGPPGGEGTALTEQEQRSREDQIQIYRDMAADAVALANAADARSRPGWLALARRWLELSYALEASAR